MLSLFCDALKMLHQAFLESLLKVLVDDADCASVCMLFARFLVCLPISCLQICLMCNFLLKMIQC
jgi:hypothetical protein